MYDAPIRNVSTDCYGRWYYWQLPEDQATVVTRLVVWILYVLHQLLHWIFIWFAQQDKLKMINENNNEIYTGKLRWYNWALIAVTYLFHIFHGR